MIAATAISTPSRPRALEHEEGKTAVAGDESVLHCGIAGPSPYFLITTALGWADELTMYDDVRVGHERLVGADRLDGLGRVELGGEQKPEGAVDAPHLVVDEALAL